MEDRVPPVEGLRWAMREVERELDCGDVEHQSCSATRPAGRAASRLLPMAYT